MPREKPLGRNLVMALTLIGCWWGGAGAAQAQTTGATANETDAQVTEVHILTTNTRLAQSLVESEEVAVELRRAGAMSEPSLMLFEEAIVDGQKPPSTVLAWIDVAAGPRSPPGLLAGIEHNIEWPEAERLVREGGAILVQVVTEDAKGAERFLESEEFERALNEAGVERMPAVVRVGELAVGLRR